VILVVDVGTSSVRVSLVRADATIAWQQGEPLLPSSPAPGLVELDAASTARAVRELAAAAVDAAGGAGAVAAVGIANQRGSAVLWDRTTDLPLGPGIGWQDLRTVGRCLELQAAGFRVAPNVSATKLEALLDMADPDRTRAGRGEVGFGTIDAWVAYALSDGCEHVSDATNAALTGLRTADNRDWSRPVLDALRIPDAVLPRVVDSVGVVGVASALPGAPPIAGIAGDQQASLLGQGCVAPGDAKITFGTGAMLDIVIGSERPSFRARGPAGTYPIVCRRAGGTDTWGLEAATLTAGTAVEWLCDLGLIDRAEASHEVASRRDDGGDGGRDVWFVPALLGLGTPEWDYGARGTLLGLTRGTSRADVVRAVLTGIAHGGADLVDAAEADAGLSIERVRIDGAMSANPTFTQALADCAGRVVEVAPVREATTLGAAFLAGLAIGTWPGDDEVAATWAPSRRVEPRRVADRDRWREAKARATRWLPELSGLDL